MKLRSTQKVQLFWRTRLDSAHHVGQKSNVPMFSPKPSLSCDLDTWLSQILDSICLNFLINCLQWIKTVSRTGHVCTLLIFRHFHSHHIRNRIKISFSPAGLCAIEVCPWLLELIGSDNANISGMVCQTSILIFWDLHPGSFWIFPRVI